MSKLKVENSQDTLNKLTGCISQAVTVIEWAKLAINRFSAPTQLAEAFIFKMQLDRQEKLLAALLSEQARLIGKLHH